MSKVTRLATSIKNGVYHVFIVDGKDKLSDIFSLKLNDDELRYLSELESPYLNEDHVKQMANFRQHGKTSTLDHVMRVAETAYKMDKKLHLHSDKQDLIAAALLHDFYLYDWHEAKIDHHSSKHAGLAADNAIKYFDVDEKTAAAIRSHMWPISPTKLPKSREAFLVTLADKYCSTIEMVKRRKPNKTRQSTADSQTDSGKDIPDKH